MSEEHRYRRVLRLLPAGYRQRWEEDMISAFVESGRPVRGEWLSVVTLATRLWLTGDYATPRGQAWRRAVHVLVAALLLTQALAGVVAATTWTTVVLGGGQLRSGERIPFDSSSVWPTSILAGGWLELASGLLCIAIFICYVTRRLTAAPLLALLIAAAQLGLTIAFHVSVEMPRLRQVYSGVGFIIFAGLLFFGLFVGRGGTSRRVWLGALLTGALILVPLRVIGLVADPAGPLWWVRGVNLDLLIVTALIVGIVMALVRRSTPWLLALAAFPVAYTLIVRFAIRFLIYLGGSSSQFVPVQLVLWFLAVLLALVCAIVGVFGLVSAAPPWLTRRTGTIRN